MVRVPPTAGRPEPTIIEPAFIEPAFTVPAFIEPTVIAVTARIRRPGARICSVALALLLAAGCSAAAPRRARPTAPTAPKLSITTLKGARLSLNELRGHLVVLDFMASWCRPCERAVPHYVAMAKRWPERLRVVLISQDEERQDIQDFAERLRISLPIGLDRGERWYRTFAIEGLPSAVILDEQGHVRARIGAEEGDFGAGVQAAVTALLDPGSER